jgi:hypothetical protein
MHSFKFEKRIDELLRVSGFGKVQIEARGGRPLNHGPITVRGDRDQEKILSLRPIAKNSRQLATVHSRHGDIEYARFRSELIDLFQSRFGIVADVRNETDHVQERAERIGRVFIVVDA